MKLNNSAIVGFVQSFDKYFSEEKQYFPAKINFYIHKNIENLLVAAKTIEAARNDIIKHYGQQGENDTVVFTEENRQKANEEIAILLNLEQDIPISFISLNDLDGLNFTPQQMRCLMFMIEEY